MPRFRAAVEIHLKTGVFDPAGQAVARSLAQLGHATVGGVRVGKHLALALDAPDAAAAEREVDAMCRELLANPIIETYCCRVEAEPVGSESGVGSGSNLEIVSPEVSQAVSQAGSAAGSAAAGASPGGGRQ